MVGRVGAGSAGWTGVVHDAGWTGRVWGGSGRASAAVRTLNAASPQRLVNCKAARAGKVRRPKFRSPRAPDPAERPRRRAQVRTRRAPQCRGLRPSLPRVAASAAQ